jgi:transposase InsO family protein
VVTPGARRAAALYLRQAYEMSERRACRVIGTDRTSVRYQGVRPTDDALRERLKALAQERRRFGYRRLHVLLRREGRAVNKKRVQRLYREERLTVRGAADANGRWERGGRSRRRWQPTSAGAWTPARTAPRHDCQRQRHRADLERHPGLGG